MRAIPSATEVVAEPNAVHPGLARGKTEVSRADANEIAVPQIEFIGDVGHEERRRQRQAANICHLYIRAGNTIAGHLGNARIIMFDPVIVDIQHDLTWSKRSEERSGGKERVSTCRSRWSPNH